MLGGLGDLGKMGAMLKQAMEMKGRIEELKAELAREEIETSVGGGMVTVRVTGTMEILSIKIDPEIVNPNDVQTLEEMVQSAVNMALQTVQERTRQRMSDIAGGYNIPGLT